ncbi:MAG: hypothetical protein WAN36_10850, partial [Calditrichia bacterium]
MKTIYWKVYFSLLLFWIIPGYCGFGVGQADSMQTQTMPKVYLDCWFCDFDYIRSEIPFVNYVYDRANADIHILITRQPTGSGGREYTLTFLGKGAFSSNDTLSLITLHDDTDDDVRRKLSHTIEIGLIPYIYNTGIMQNLSIDYKGVRDTIITRDKWKLWFFRINFSGYFDGEATASSHSFTNRLSADRITEKWKIRASTRLSYEEDTYEIEDKKLTSSESHKQFNLTMVKSLNNHWSAGFSTRYFSSTYDNISGAFSV